MASPLIDPSAFRTRLLEQFESVQVEATEANLAAAQEELARLLDDQKRVDRCKLIAAYGLVANALGAITAGAPKTPAQLCEIGIALAVLKTVQSLSGDQDAGAALLARAEQKFHGLTASGPRVSVAVQFSGAVALGGATFQPSAVELPSTPQQRRAGLLEGLVAHIRNLTADDDSALPTETLAGIIDRATDDLGGVSGPRLKALIDAEADRAMGYVIAYVNGTAPLPRHAVGDLPPPVQDGYLGLFAKFPSVKLQFFSLSYLNNFLSPDDSKSLELQALGQVMDLLRRAEQGEKVDLQVWTDEPAGGMAAPRGLLAHAGQVASDMLDGALTVAGRLAHGALSLIPHSFAKKLWQMPLPDLVYTEPERMRLAWAYAWPKLQLLFKALRHVDMFDPALKPSERDGILKSMGKWVVRHLRLTALASAGTDRARKLTGPEIESLIPPEARLTPVGRDMVVQVMRAFLEGRKTLTLSSLLSTRIDEAYGFDPALARDFKKYTLAHLNFIVEDTAQRLALYEKDVPLDDAPVKAAREAHVAAAKRVYSQIPELQFAAMRDIHEARLLIEPPVDDDVASEAFTALQEAERQLGDLLTAGADESDRIPARDRVARAHARYADAAGLAAGAETFLYLSEPASGLVLEPPVLRQLLNRKIDDGMRQHVLDVHAALHQTSESLGLIAERQKAEEAKIVEAFKADLKAGLDKDKAKEKKEQALAGIAKAYEPLTHSARSAFDTQCDSYRQVMRGYLDQPRLARLLQGALLKYHAVRDALIKDPAGFFWSAYSSLETQPAMLGHDDYISVVMEYQALRALPYRTKAQEQVMEQCRQKATIKAWKLLHSHKGPEIVFEGIKQLKSRTARMAQNPAYQQAIDTHHAYWRERRIWAAAEKQRCETLLTDIARFKRFHMNGVNGGLLMEVDIMLRASETMMAQALAAANSATAKKLDELRTLHAKALSKFRETAEQAATQAPTEAFAGEWRAQIAHVDLFLKDRQDEHPEPSKTHRVKFNRALEDCAKHAAAAYHLAARALHRAGLAPKPPRLIGFQAAGIFSKMAPDQSLQGHARDAAYGVNFMGDGVLPVVRDAVQAIGAGLPDDHVQPAIQKWARQTTFGFHHTRVDDRRDGNVLPGAVAFMNGAHANGWYFDYAATLALGSYVLVAKGNLDGTLPGPMGTGVPVLAVMLPERVTAIEAQARVTRILLYGYTQKLPAGELVRVGSQGTALYGAMTMSGAINPDPCAVLDQGALLSDRQTGLELTGIGRDQGSLQSAAAVYGSLAKVPDLELTSYYGGSEVGSKPDTVMRIRPGDVHVRVESVDPLAIPDGGTLGHQHHTPFVRVKAHELYTWHVRQKGTFEGSSRRMMAAAPAPVRGVGVMSASALASRFMPLRLAPRAGGFLGTVLGK